MNKWIIPARAGFTHNPSPSNENGWDHPRSRGVYTRATRPTAASKGSSPLARGLRGRCEPRSWRSSDHPRSRGVYLRKPLRRPPGGGSSPLARGLPPLVDLGSAVDGIIPARAGFTAQRAGRHAHVRDHPRSRGVYCDASGFISVIGGSSPLARGLREFPSARERYRRIIPARAGFTDQFWFIWAYTEDHPRSRGVYVETRSALGALPGSSPLARGLPFLIAIFLAPYGIIPARAGFTGDVRGGDRG